MKSHLMGALAAAALTALCTSQSFAGAWTAKRNAFYEKVSFNYFEASKSFDPSGGRQDLANNGRFTDYNISNYFEYGVLDDLTVINSLSYKWLENDDVLARRKGHGLGDVEIGARYKLLDSAPLGIVSTQLVVKIPGTYEKTDPLPLGNEQFDTELRLQYGRSLYPLIPGYGNLEIGYRWRAEDPSDELRYLVEFGLDFTKSVYGRLKLDGTFSVDNGTKTDGSGNPTATNNYDLGKLEVTLGYQVTPSWGVEAAYRPDIYGQNTAAGANYSLGLYYKTP